MKCKKAFVRGSWRKEKVKNPSMMTCKKCGKAEGEYYEGILQLRNVRDDVLECIRDFVDKNKDRGFFITKEKKAYGGLDFYVTSQRIIQTLGKRLEARFGGKCVVSPHLQSRDRQKSKNLYRVNVLYRVPAVCLGDLVSWDKGVGMVLKVGKKKVTIDNFLIKSNSTIELGDVKLLVVYSTTVSKIKPSIEVLHPETYQSVEVSNVLDVKNGEKVKVVMWKGVWLV
jgi:NMD protein affecting ribosome stability and mRNA decay